VKRLLSWTPIIAMAIGLLGAIVAGAVAYGGQQEKIGTLEEAIKKQQTIEDRVNQNYTQGQVIDERTKRIQQDQERIIRQQEAIQRLLRGLSDGPR